MKSPRFNIFSTKILVIIQPPCYSVPQDVRSAIASGELRCLAALKNVTIVPDGGFTLDQEDVPADAEMHQMLDKQIISDKV